MKMGEEQQYLGLIRDIIDRGAWELGRNGRTKSIFGHSMRFSLKDGTVPILTTKTVAWKTCFRELMWFIRGSTDNRELVKQGVHIWDGNADRRFLDSRGLFFNKVGDLGPIYGHQWRHFNAEYSDFDTDYSGKGIDQLQYIIDQLRDPENRSSRRLVMTAWNPCQIQQMALPPCHIMAQFNVREGKYLSCALYQRSGDVGLGVPFNIASYSFLTHILAKHCGLEAEEFVYFLGNAHIYEEHMSILTSQMQRDPLSFPRMQITRTHESVEDYSIDDMEWISEYKSLGSLKMEFVA